MHITYCSLIVPYLHCNPQIDDQNLLVCHHMVLDVHSHQSRRGQSYHSDTGRDPESPRMALNQMNGELFSPCNSRM